MSDFIPECNKRYVRIHDMSPDGKLIVIRQEDGDMIVAIASRSPLFGRMVFADVEFCTLRGGGKSPAVRDALVNLAKAIERDNQEHPR